MSIPIISLKDDEFDKKFGQALEEYGFVSIIDHNLNQELLNKAYDLTVKIFDLPDSIKKEYETPANGRRTGYTSFGIEHSKDDLRPDLKEMWHIYDHFHNIGTSYPKEISGCRGIFGALHGSLSDISGLLLQSLDRYIGKYELYNMCIGGNSLLRLIHYPKIESQNVVGVRSAPHEDINLLTLLVAATKPGLQVKTRSGELIDVNNPPEAIVVNAGDMLQLYSFGRFKSATHQVINTNIEVESRYSMPFFVHPRSNAILVTAGDYLEHRLKEIGLSK